MSAAGAKTRADLGWHSLCEAWASRAHTERGSERARTRGANLEIDLEAAIVQMTRVEEARRLRAESSPLQFGGITDVLLALARAEKGAALEPDELLAVARAARGCDRLAKGIRSGRQIAPSLCELATAIADLGHVYHPILESFDEDGRLSDSASEALGRLRKRALRLVSELDENARTLLDDPRISPHLQDRFYTQRDERYVIPVKVESRGQVGGIVHGTSQSGQTVFIEPQALVDLNNKLKLAECEVADEERRIYAELSRYVEEETVALRDGLEAATEIDVIDAAARLADDLNATVPIVSPEGEEINLAAAVHPLMVLSGKVCVANNIVLERGRGLIISGPNAGGKTVALKTAGLAALMVRAGLPVAAKAGSQMPWFELVASDIGDAQSLEMDLSTFSAKLLRLGEFHNQAGHGALMLVDEIAVGTEPEQGAALAQSILETFVEAGATVIATTHYERLKMLAGSDERFGNASVGFDIEKLEPTFKLTIGSPGASGALRVARRLGMPRSVLARAEDLLGDQRASVDALIESLERARTELDDERAQLGEMREELAEAQRSAARSEARAKELEKKAREGAHSEATEALKEARRELESARVRVRKKGVDGDLKAIESDIDQAARQIGANAPAKPAVGREARAEELVVGQPVFITTLAARGEILEPPRSGKVVVAVGSLRTTAAVGDLRIEPGRVRKPAAPKSKKPAPEKRRDAAAPAAIVRAPDATLDLRGQRADEATDELDRFLDQSMLATRHLIVVIHGHGTGALRIAVRSHLEGHPTVLAWRRGELSEGGDGVTVAELDI